LQIPGRLRHGAWARRLQQALRRLLIQHGIEQGMQFVLLYAVGRHALRLLKACVQIGLNRAPALRI